MEGLLHNPIVLADHGMSFTWAGLSVYENTRVVAVEEIAQELIADMVEDVGLGGGGREDFVERELMLFEFDLCFSERDDALILGVGSDPNENLDGILTWNLIHFW